MVVAIKGPISLSRGQGQLIVTAEPMGKEMIWLQQSFRLEKKCPTWMGSWPVGLLVKSTFLCLELKICPVKWRSRWDGGMEWLSLGSAIFSEADVEVKGCQDHYWGFPFLRRLLPSPRWGCGPLTLQTCRLDLTHCFMIQFSQLSSCLPLPVERFQ